MPVGAAAETSAQWQVAAALYAWHMDHGAGCTKNARRRDHATGLSSASGYRRLLVPSWAS